MNGLLTAFGAFVAAAYLVNTIVVPQASMLFAPIVQALH